MGGCVTICQNPNKDMSDVQVIASKQNIPKGGKRIKRIKTKFPKNGKNFEDDDEEEEKSQEKKEENKGNEDKNNDKINDNDNLKSN